MLSTLKCFNALLKDNDCSSIVDPFEWRFPLFISFARILVSARCPEVHQNPFSCLFTFPPRCSGFIKRCHISGDDLNMLRKIIKKIYHHRLCMKVRNTFVMCSFPSALSFCVSGAQLYSFRCNACSQHQMDLCLINTEIIEWGENAGKLNVSIFFKPVLGAFYLLSCAYREVHANAVVIMIVIEMYYPKVKDFALRIQT